MITEAGKTIATINGKKMNKELLDFIKELTANDKKTLLGKTLKTTEELGELAKAVLPYENASGTLHRFVHKRQILENTIDVMLCAYSIAYDLGYNDQEIEDMMFEKTAKWSGIQAKEGKVKFPLPFEIHVTIERPNDIELFKGICKQIGVKPIILDLEKAGETVMLDVMTSSVHFGDNASAMKEAERIAMELGFPHEHFVNDVTTDTDWLSYKVTRIKIETVPWHPAAPSIADKNSTMPPSNYFESHLRIVTTKERRVELQEIADQYDAHLSRNYFKKLNESEFIIMMTLRSNKTKSEIFQLEVEELKSKLITSGFVVDKTEVEFAVYDTNVNHDSKWIER